MNFVEGTELEVNIEDVAFGGKGVARIDGVVCFIPFTLPGEKVSIRISSVKKNFLEAEVVEILEASEDRVEAPCEHFTKCGGCQYQHVKYERQLDLKKDQLLQVLKRIGGIDEIPEIEGVIPSDKQYNYRNRISLTPRKLEEREVIYGYKDINNKELIEIDNCPLADEKVNKALAGMKMTTYGKKNLRRDRPKSPTIRTSANDETVIYFGGAPNAMPWRKENLKDRSFSVPLGSFYQVNPGVAEKLFDKVNEWSKDIPVNRVVDTFCGAGFLSVGIEDKHIVGIESDAPSIDAAQYNAMQWGVKTFQYFAGDANKLVNRQLRNKGKHTWLIMDPPRKGCGPESIEAIRKHKPAWILYVSCDPATLARDLKQLLSVADYKIEKVAVFDMFPQTAHFETMVLLKGSEEDA